MRLLHVWFPVLSEHQAQIIESLEEVALHFSLGLLPSRFISETTGDFSLWAAKRGWVEKWWLICFIHSTWGFCFQNICLKISRILHKGCRNIHLSYIHRTWYGGNWAFPLDINRRVWKNAWKGPKSLVLGKGPSFLLDSKHCVFPEYPVRRSLFSQIPYHGIHYIQTCSTSIFIFPLFL